MLGTFKQNVSKKFLLQTYQAIVNNVEANWTTINEISRLNLGILLAVGKTQRRNFWLLLSQNPQEKAEEKNAM